MIAQKKSIMYSTVIAHVHAHVYPTYNLIQNNFLIIPISHTTPNII